MLFSQHSYHPEINIGLFLVYSRKRPREMFQKINNWLDSEEREPNPVFCGSFDQKILDYAVRGEGQLVNVCKTSSIELKMLYNISKQKINWTYIPYSHVPHPPIGKDLSKVFAIHLWSGQSKLIRYEYAFKNGFWSKFIPPIISLHSNNTIKIENTKFWFNYLGYNFNTSYCLSPKHVN